MVYCLMQIQKQKHGRTRITTQTKTWTFDLLCYKKKTIYQVITLVKLEQYRYDITLQLLTQ